MAKDGPAQHLAGPFSCRLPLSTPQGFLLDYPMTQLEGIIAPDGSAVGFAALPSADRIVWALPLDNGPVLLDRGSSLLYVVDAQGVAVTLAPALWVDRLLHATTTINSRGL